MKMLVTGGAGFLGSHLCDRLRKEGHGVICLDNFSTGSVSNVENCYILERDVIKPLLIYPTVDQIYHLACPASPKHYQLDSVHTYKTNIFGSLNMLEIAKEREIPILLSSTSEVYGDPMEHPQRESYWGNVNPIGPRSCYDEGKRCAEGLFLSYHSQFKVDTKIVRIFNTYGPRMRVDDGRVISNFIVQALNNLDITIYGDGSQTRSFCYVDDLIDGMIRMMNSELAGPLNLGNPQECTVLELAEKIISLTDSGSKIIFHPLPVDDPKRRQPDITLARTLLDWEPKVSLEDGLKETIRYFRNGS